MQREKRFFVGLLKDSFDLYVSNLGFLVQASICFFIPLLILDNYFAKNKMFCVDDAPDGLFALPFFS